MKDKITDNREPETGKKTSKRYRRLLGIFGGIALVLIGGGVGLYFGLSGSRGELNESWIPEIIASITGADTIVKDGTATYTDTQEAAAAQAASFSRQLTDLVLNPSPSAVVRNAAATTTTTSSSKKPSIAKLLTMSLDAIKAVNKDFYGIIKVPGADIEELVVLTQDETKYFRYDFYHNYDRYGTIFVDNATSWDKLDNNTIVYGHNRGKYSQNYKKFGTLTYFRKDGYAKKYPYIYLETFHGTYTFQIFSVFVRHAYVPASEYDRSYLRYTFNSTAAMNTWINNVKALSMYDTGVSVSGTDKVITLITCVYDYDDAKLIVMGKLINTQPANTSD